MAYQTIVSATSVDEFQSEAPDIDLPPGTKVKIRMELPPWAPVGKLADLAGAEWIAQQFAPAEVRVTDVYGNWHWMEIEGVVEGTPVLLLVTIIIGMLSALGIAYLISKIVLQADWPEVGKPISLMAVAAIAVAAVAGIYLLRRAT